MNNLPNLTDQDRRVYASVIYVKFSPVRENHALYTQISTWIFHSADGLAAVVHLRADSDRPVRSRRRRPRTIVIALAVLTVLIQRVDPTVVTFGTVKRLGIAIEAVDGELIRHRPVHCG